MTTWTARPTTYKGIKMRSRLEARMAAEIDEWGDPWAYEPRAFANEYGQYLPDFQVDVRGLKSGHPWFIEVKPTQDAALTVIERMQIIWDSEPGATLSVFYPKDGGPDSDWAGLIAYGTTDRRWRTGH